MKKKLSWSLALSLVAALAAWAGAPPPNLQRALDAQRALLEREPENAAAEVDLGNLLLLDGESEDAEAAYRRAIEFDPESVAAHFNLGLLLQERRDGFAALRSYRRVLKLDPEHAWAHYQIGVLHDGWNLKGAAIDAYAQAFALDPRLRFSDVNPHVIENRYLTEAMLRAYRQYVPAALPPQTYEEPRRIAAILLQEGEPKSAPPERVAAGASAAGTAVEGTEPALAGGETRVLSAGDLGSGPVTGQLVGQARPGGAAVAGVGAPGDAIGEDAERYEPPVFQINTDETAPAAPNAVGFPIYPGAESSGRLEMKLRAPGDRRALG